MQEGKSNNQHNHNMGQLSMNMLTNPDVEALAGGIERWLAALPPGLLATNAMISAIFNLDTKNLISHVILQHLVSDGRVLRLTKGLDFHQSAFKEWPSNTSKEWVTATGIVKIMGKVHAKCKYVYGSPSALLEQGDLTSPLASLRMIAEQYATDDEEEAHYSFGDAEDESVSICTNGEFRLACFNDVSDSDGDEDDLVTYDNDELMFEPDWTDTTAILTPDWANALDLDVILNSVVC